MPFPNLVNITQAPAVAGDFASYNQRHSLLSVPGGFVAGTGGVTIGFFVWADTATGTVLNNFGTGIPSAFMHRDQQAMLSVYLSEFGLTIPAGMGIGEAFNAGDFWVKNGGGAVTVQMKAYTSNTTGAVSFAAPGGTISGSTETKWFAMSAGAAGELIKMSSTPIG